jgi:hypothetical protein
MHLKIKKSCYILLFMLCCGFGISKVSAQGGSLRGFDECNDLPSKPPTMGLEECQEKCYMQKCGTAGLRCPTEALKNSFRTMCHGKCVEMIRRQEDQRQLILYCRDLHRERDRADRYRKALILRHRQWAEKRKLVASLRMQYEEAKRRRQNAVAIAHIRRMQLAHEQQMQHMHEKLQIKERFYLARAEMRHKQRQEMLRQVAQLNKEVADAKSKNEIKRLAELRKLVLAKQKKAQNANKQEKKLKVDYHETRVQRHEQQIKDVQEQRQNIKEIQKDANEKKDQKQLEDLAKQLGELAGKQAALTRNAELERDKLKQAKMAYSTVAKQQTVNTP